MRSLEKETQDRERLESFPDASSTPAWAILLDTGAATSVAPEGFASHLELSPAPSTLQLSTATGEAIKIFGLRHVHLQSQDLSFTVSFVIADVVTPILGLDTLQKHSFNLNLGHDEQNFLVTKAGKRTQLQTKGEHLYLVAFPFQHGLSHCRRGSLPEVIGFLPEDKELHDQKLALQSSSSTDLDEDQSFLDSLHVHENSACFCLPCDEDVAVSGGELFTHSFPSMQQQQPKNLTRADKQLHNHHPRSSELRSEELEEAKGNALHEKIAHTLSAACVHDLPDTAWHDPSLLCRGQPQSQPSGKKKLGTMLTHKPAASQNTRCSKQEATRIATSKALLSVLSSGRLASFGGGSLVALMVSKPVPRNLAASKLPCADNLPELGKAAAKSSFKRQSLISILCFAFLSLTWFSPALTATESLHQEELVAAYASTAESLQQKELEATYSDKRSLTAFTEQLCFKASHQIGPTRVRELELLTAQLCKHDFAMAQFSECSTRASRTTAAGKLQVAGDLRSPESIPYVPLPQTMQSYLALDVHDMYMDLRNVVQNNLAGKGPDPAGAEELRYENVFPNLTTGSVDLVVQAETSSHPKRPANNGVKGEVGSINFRGGRSTTFLFKFVATFIMAVWANLPFSLWPGMGMNAYFAYTIVGFKGQSNPVKKVMFAVAIEGVIFIVMSSLDIRRMIFKIFPAWMMKATMAGIGMFVAFIGLQSGKGIDIIRDHPAVLVDLVEELPEDSRA